MGELGHLPFEVFLLQPRKVGDKVKAPQQVTDYQKLHYLVSDYNISYNYSASLWKENKEAESSKNNEQILAMAANYDIKLDSAVMDVRLPTYHSIESNFWQAHEISKIQLNADLVVLSACETGYGRFAGNGIASLARAFMYAGSPALIVSLWQVNNFATSEIIKNLYNNLADGMKKDEALRQVKLQYMKSAKGFAAHPAFWSPFIMMGKTDAVIIERKGNPKIWWIGGFLTLLTLGILIVSKRR